MERIYYICNFEADYGGNFIESLISLQNLLSINHVQCFYLFPEGAKNKNWIIRLGNNVEYCNFSLLEMKRKLDEYLISNCVIHTHFVGAREIIAIKAAGKRKKIKIIYHMHNRYEDNNGFFQILMKRVIYKNVVFVGVSSAVYRDLLRVFKYNKCYCVSNAISVERLVKSDGKTSIGRTALMFGTHYKRKGVDLAIRAINNLYDIYEDIRLVIVVHDLKKTKEIIENEFGYFPDFVCLQLPIEDVCSLYKKSKVFLAPARSEAFGYALIEAAYCGCKVIATNIPGQNTMNDVPGIKWIESESSEELQRSLFEMINYENSSYELIKTRTYIEKKYSLTAWCNKIMQIYKEL